MPKLDKWIQVGEITFGSKGSGKTQRITVTLPDAIAAELVRESTDRQTTVSALVREAVTEYFADREAGGLPEFVGMGEHPDPDLSERVEEIMREDFASGDPDRG